MKNENNNRADLMVLTLIVVLLLGVVAMVARGVDYAVKYEVRKTNSAWVDELDRRGLIIRTDGGSFRWKPKLRAGQ